MLINILEYLEQHRYGNMCAIADEKESNEGKKKVYYISAEFLIGKLLSNNMINLGIYNEVKEMLAQAGKNISEIEEIEASLHQK